MDTGTKHRIVMMYLLDFTVNSIHKAVNNNGMVSRASIDDVIVGNYLVQVRDECNGNDTSSKLNRRVCKLLNDDKSIDEISKELNEPRYKIIKIITYNLEVI